MELIFATNNEHKLHEVRELMSGYGITVRSLREAGCNHETVEDGLTFRDKARKKAVEISEIRGKPVVADDTGLCVAALDGGPGVYSNRFAPKGLHCEKLLEAMAGVTQRDAYFETAVVCVFPDGREYYANGVVEGYITTEKYGDYDFGYDQVFFVKEAGKTFGEMTIEEKNGYSHRARAFSAFVKILEGLQVEGE